MALFEKVVMYLGLAPLTLLISLRSATAPLLDGYGASTLNPAQANAAARR